MPWLVCCHGGHSRSKKVILLVTSSLATFVGPTESMHAEIETGKHGYPFDEVLFCNIGNPHLVGQQPIDYNRFCSVQESAYVPFFFARCWCLLWWAQSIHMVALSWPCQEIKTHAFASAFQVTSFQHSRQETQNHRKAFWKTSLKQNFQKQAITGSRSFVSKTYTWMCEQRSVCSRQLCHSPEESLRSQGLRARCHSARARALLRHQGACHILMMWALE